MDIYSDFFSSVMPDVALTGPLHDIKGLTQEELVSIAKAFGKYSRLVGRFVEGRHTASGTNSSHSDWDLRFEETLNDAIHSIPLEKFNTRCYPVEKLVWMGWAVLAVYRLDVEKNERFLSSIVRKLLNENLTKKSAEFFNKLCEKKDELHLPLTIFEDIVAISPLYIENLIVDLLHSLGRESSATCRFHKFEAFFQRPNLQSWLKSCSQSSKIFQVFVNIINTLLLRSKGHPSTVTFVQEFHLAVKKLLPEKSSIAVLYPHHLQSLVVNLDKGPEHHSVKFKNTNNKEILELLMDGLMCDRNRYLCLLSHFPLWIPNLFRYAISRGEARVLSNCCLEQDCEQFLKDFDPADMLKNSALLVKNYKA